MNLEITYGLGDFLGSALEKSAGSSTYTSGSSTYTGGSSTYTDSPRNFIFSVLTELFHYPLPIILFISILTHQNQFKSH